MSVTPAVQKRLEECPNRSQHVKGAPEGYINWHAWAERKAKTHTQHRCKGCGLWAIWRRRR